MTVVAGATIGAYRIIEQIGRGGMATVYKAYQPALARNVAIKVLPQFFAEDPGSHERFQQEAIAIAKLRHPNILAVFDYGEENGITYIASEFVDGGTLAEQLGTPLPADYVVRILGPIASALDYAHARGVLHRDVKPSNVLLARDGTPILSDFGLAKMVGTMPRLTQSGMAVGTPEYMAPEQAMGEEVGPGTDLYALAVVAYEMLTGRVPYSAETPLAVLLAHVHKPLPLPRSLVPSLSPELEAVLLKGLAKTAAERYPTATELVHALDVAVRGQAPALSSPAPFVVAPAAGVTSGPPAAAVPAPAAGPGRRLPLPLILGGGLVALGLIGAIAFVLTRPAAAPSGAVGLKGALVWTAALDPAEFSAFPGLPDAEAATVRTLPGAIEMAVMRPEGRTALEFEKLLPERYLAEWDVELSGPLLVFDVRLASEPDGMQYLRVATGPQALHLEEVRCAGGNCTPTPLSPERSVPLAGDGRRVTLGVAAGPTGYAVFVDGARVVDASVKPMTRGLLGLEVFGPREGTVRIVGLRLYELLGSLP